MSISETMQVAIPVLLFAIWWELDKIRQHTDTLRRIAWKEHFGEPPT
jgi:hypothetical protein